MSNEEGRIKHLEFIQGVISRMAQNSFSLKAWAVTLVSGLIALAADKSNPDFIVLALVPVTAFWVLDGYFLRQERLFRKLYDIVRLSQDKPDFSLNTAPVSKQVHCWPCTMFSVTLNIFYGVLVLAISIAALYFSR